MTNGQSPFLGALDVKDPQEESVALHDLDPPPGNFSAPDIPHVSQAEPRPSPYAQHLHNTEKDDIVPKIINHHGKPPIHQLLSNQPHGTTTHNCSAEHVPPSQGWRNFHIELLQLPQHGLMRDQVGLQLLALLARELLEELLAPLWQLDLLLMLVEEIKAASMQSPAAVTSPGTRLLSPRPCLNNSSLLR
jgi:hypothetical protein